MKNLIQHKVEIGGIVYKILEAEDVENALEFFFAVFFKGKSNYKKIITLKAFAVTIVMF